MRLQLKESKQKELILKAKSDMSWKQLGKILRLNSFYLSNELAKEKRLISKEVFDYLNKLVDSDYNKFIINTFDDNWGRSKGGKNSPKNVKKFIKPNRTPNLAELVGIILGDGHIEERKDGKKIRCYSIKIVGDKEKDRDYIQNHISNLFWILFKKKGKFMKLRRRKQFILRFMGKNC